MALRVHVPQLRGSGRRDAPLETVQLGAKRACVRSNQTFGTQTPPRSDMKFLTLQEARGR